MIKLVEAGDRNIDNVCSELMLEHYDWVLLDKDQIKKIASSLGEGKDTLWNKTFILPGHLVSARMHLSKINRLVAYMVYQGRKQNWTFMVVAPNLKSIDKRLRNMLAEV